jgi:hypothetical protein
MPGEEVKHFVHTSTDKVQRIYNLAMEVAETPREAASILMLTFLMVHNAHRTPRPSREQLAAEVAKMIRTVQFQIHDTDPVQPPQVQ